MDKELYIIEFEDEADFFYTQNPRFGKDGSIVVSVMPEVQAKLLRYGVSCENTTHYFDGESHKKALVAVDAMMQQVRDCLEIKDGNGISEAYHNSLCNYLRRYVSYLVWMTEVVSNAIKQNGIKRVHVCSYSNNNHSHYMLNANERILGDLVACFNDQVEIVKHESAIKHDAWEEKLVSMFVGAVNTIYHWLDQLFYKDGKPAIMLCTLKYNFDEIIKKFGDRYRYFNVSPTRKQYFRMHETIHGADVCHLHLLNIKARKDADLQQSWKKSLQNLKNLESEKRVFTYNDIDFGTIVINKIEKGFIGNFRKMSQRIDSLNKIINKTNPKLIVSAMGREFGYAIGELSKKNNIPSVLISHGSHVPPKNDFDRLEWLDHGKGLIDTDYGYHLLQSPWAKDYIADMSSKDNYYNIHPLIFAKVEKGEKEKKQLTMYPQTKGKRIIVHASSPKMRKATRFYIYETMDEYVENIKDLIKATKEMQDVFLIIRFRPKPNLTLETLQSVLPKADHYTIATEGSFEDYLKIADLLVSFSSTTIEEALTSEIPVLQYDRTGRYVHINGSNSKDGQFDEVNSVYWIGHQQELISGLRWIVDNHLNEGVDAGIFNRHVFKEEEADQAGDFINNLLEAQPA